MKQKSRIDSVVYFSLNISKYDVCVCLPHKYAIQDNIEHKSEKTFKKTYSSINIYKYDLY